MIHVNLSPRRFAARAHAVPTASGAPRRVAAVPAACARSTVDARRGVPSHALGASSSAPRLVARFLGARGARRARAPFSNRARGGLEDDRFDGARAAASASDAGVADDDADALKPGGSFLDDESLDEILDFDDGLDDPFAGVASAPGAEAAFEAMLDDIVGGAGDDPRLSPSLSPADASPAGFSDPPSDAEPWDPGGSWPEFDAFLAKLAGMGYSLESPNAPPGWSDDAEAGAPKLSTPEWARAVAESADGDADAAEAEAATDGDGDASSLVRMDLDDDPFAHVASDEGPDADATELTYSNKKRLLLEFSRDRDDAFDRLSERELYVLADHPMPHNQGNSSGRKQVNALKRLRAHLGVDDSDLRGRCAAADHDQNAMGAVKLSDVLRVVHVYADDVKPQDRPPRAVMQSLLRRLTSLADSPRAPASATRGGGAGSPATPKQPRWVERRERRPERPEFEEDRYAPSRGESRGRGKGRGGGFDRGRRGDGFASRGRPRRYEDDGDYRRDKARRRRFDDFDGAFSGGRGRGRGGGRGYDAYGSDDGWDTRPPPSRRRDAFGDGYGGGGAMRSRGGRGGGFGRRNRTQGGFGSDLDGLELDEGSPRGGYAPRGRGEFGGRGSRGKGAFGGRGGRGGGRGGRGYGDDEFAPRGRGGRGRGSRGGGGYGHRGGGFVSESDGYGGYGGYGGGGRPERGSRFDREFTTRSGRGGRGGRDGNHVRLWKPRGGGDAEDNLSSRPDRSSFGGK